MNEGDTESAEGTECTEKWRGSSSRCSVPSVLSVNTVFHAYAQKTAGAGSSDKR